MSEKHTPSIDVPWTTDELARAAAALSDEEMGGVLLEIWIQEQAIRKGVSPSQIAIPNVLSHLLDVTAKVECEDAKHAALEKAFRFLHRGENAKAGAIFRGIIFEGARSIKLSQLAASAARRKSQLASFAKKGARASVKYTAEDRERWKKEARLLPQDMSKKRKAELVAKRLGLPTEAEQSIRKEL